jgi:hypothetical protein
MTANSSTASGRVEVFRSRGKYGLAVLAMLVMLPVAYWLATATTGSRRLPVEVMNFMGTVYIVFGVISAPWFMWRAIVVRPALTLLPDGIDYPDFFRSRIAWSDIRTISLGDWGGSPCLILVLSPYAGAAIQTTLVGRLHRTATGVRLPLANLAVEPSQFFAVVEAFKRS